MRHVILNAAAGTEELVNYEFRVDCPYAGCGICGRVYQTAYDRLDNPSPREVELALDLRTMWRGMHAKTHTDREHRQLRLSGLLATPEAAAKLASYGIIVLSDSVRSDEIVHAFREAPRAPNDDSDS